jgi:hypothetical protein
MTDMHTSSIMDSLVLAMETMAFTTPTLADPSLYPSPDSLHVSMPFTGPARGTVELVASEKVGIGLAATILATTPEDPAARRYARDALKELLNVTCGLILPKLVPKESDATPFRMTLPELVVFDSQTQWQAFAAAPDTCILDVEGSLIALRVTCA